MAHSRPETLFERVLIPVASEADARLARETLFPYLEGVGEVATVVHVIKHLEDGVTAAPVSKQAEDAEELFEIVRATDSPLDVQTRKAYGENVAESIFEVAREIDASAVVFSPQEKSRWIRLLTGDTALSLVTNPEIPVLSIPRRD